jgi:ectoine hydroxylase-related dioxygenase (phytanoyl-CoA dioxygenase family)
MSTGLEPRPLTRTELQRFETDGYVVIPGVLSDAQVAQRRSLLDGEFESRAVRPGDSDVRPGLAAGTGVAVRQAIFTWYPETRYILTHPPILGAIRSLLGDDFVFLPGESANLAGYRHWHKDTTMLDNAGEDFHHAADFNLVTCAIYLQPNDEYGGGLDVVPGSHNEPDHTPPPAKPSFAQRAAVKMGVRLPGRTTYRPPQEEDGALSIPSRPGDLVIFNFRINHMASQPSACAPHAIPRDRRKFAVFFNASVNNPNVASYVDFLVRVSPHLHDGVSYPDDVLAAAAAAGVKLVTA